MIEVFSKYKLGFAYLPHELFWSRKPRLTAVGTRSGDHATPLPTEIGINRNNSSCNYS
jgi:hypothetical protein